VYILRIKAVLRIQPLASIPSTLIDLITVVSKGILILLQRCRRWSWHLGFALHGVFLMAEERLVSDDSGNRVTVKVAAP
jgi:hypothetical protein